MTPRPVTGLWAMKHSPTKSSERTATPVIIRSALGSPTNNRSEDFGANLPSSVEGVFLQGGIVSTNKSNSARLMRDSTTGRSKTKSARKQKANRLLAAKIVERFGHKQ